MVAPPPVTMPGAAWLLDAFEVLRTVHMEVALETTRTKRKQSDTTKRKTKR